MKKHMGPLLVVLLLFGLYACKSKTHRQARALSRLMDSANDTLFDAEQQWSKQMAYAVSSGDYSKIKPFRTRLHGNIDAAAATADSLASAAGAVGAVDLLDAEKNLLLLERKICEQDMPVFETFRFNTPMAKVSAAVEKLNKDGKDEQAALAQLNKLRDDFAAKNGFKFAEPAPKTDMP
jgi:hypothetical protein